MRRLRDSGTIDIERFEGSMTHELAKVVHSETEIERAADTLAFKQKHGDVPDSKNAFSLLPRDQSRSKPWFTYLTDSVLDRCEHALGIDTGDLLMRIVKELNPDNWEALFWRGSWHKLACKSQADTQRLLRRQAERYELQRQKFARAGGVARHAPLRDAKVFVIQQWSQNREAYEGNKAAFARDYVGRIKNEFDRDVTHKTIAAVWLKGA